MIWASQINYGLMGYPVLMTADILTFNADCVPVGIFSGECMINFKEIKEYLGDLLSEE